MKLYRNILFVLCALPVLGACSYFNTTPGASLESAKMVETIDLIAVDHQSTQQDARSIILSATGGRVQIFSLDDKPLTSTVDTMSNMNNAQEIEAVKTRLPGGYPIHPTTIPYMQSENPNVMIFSLDNANPYPSPRVENTAFNATPTERKRTGFNAAREEKVVVYFDHDSTKLSTNDLQKIADIAYRYSLRPAHAVNVEGHASSNANHAGEQQRKIANLKVSMSRAFAVSRALIRYGVPANSIRVRSWGDTKAPAASNGSDAESVARRVEIFG